MKIVKTVDGSRQFRHPHMVTGCGDPILPHRTGTLFREQSKNLKFAPDPFSQKPRGSRYLAAIALFSFLFQTLHPSPLVGFYSPVARIWQFLAGAVVFVAVEQLFPFGVADFTQAEKRSELEELRERRAAIDSKHAKGAGLAAFSLCAALLYFRQV